MRKRTYAVYHAHVEDCAACPLRTRGLSKSTASRRYLSIQVETQPPNLIDEMKAKIDSEEGKKIYARRLGIVEPVFANICVQKHMNRFTVRTKRKVDVQMEAIRPGTQYRQNPRVRDTELSQVCPIPPRSAAESRRLIRHQPSTVFENWVFRQSRWARVSKSLEMPL